MSKEYDRLLKKMVNKTRKNETEFILNMYQFIEGNINSNFLDYINYDYYIIPIINMIFDPELQKMNKKKYVQKLINNNIKVLKYNEKELIIELEGKELTFRNLQLTNSYFEQKDCNKNIIRYKESIYIPILIEKLRFLDQSYKIIIGNIQEETVNRNKLFAWMEFSKNNKEYVIDYVHNIIFDKESFYFFYKPNILNKIEKDNLLNDRLISILIDILNIRYDEYLIFNKEINKEVSKKKKLFKL